jgi:hypothetical protein
MSEIKVNKISPRTACGTVTLGDSGDTFTIPSGATINNQGTAVNFGATGSASWVTTVKTTGFTAVAGEGYFCNTTSGGFSVNLPAGTAGDVVAIKDYAGTFDTNAVTLVRNGSDKIGGQAINSILNTEGIAVTLVFIDSTQGWLVTDSGLQSEAPTAQYVTATGGSVTCSGDYKIHTFTGPGTFCVSCAGNASGSNTVDYLVVAGGGGGGGCGYAGGGGAGGYRESPGTASGSYTVSPLGVSPAVALPVPATAYPITVGGSGAGGTPGAPQPGTNGSNSIFSTITSAGGGGGGGEGGCGGANNGSNGGSGGGSSYTGSGGTGNTPPVSPEQGKNGGSNPAGAPTNYNVAGGGGATVAGIAGTSSVSGAGGAGATSSINGTPTARAGGGGGGAGDSDVPGAGGTGGGGAGGTFPNGTGVAATVNTGGGGGGAGRNDGTGGAGGSGIVIIRYKFQ